MLDIGGARRTILFANPFEEVHGVFARLHSGESVTKGIPK